YLTSRLYPFLSIDPSSTDTYTLSLHDALPILAVTVLGLLGQGDRAIDVRHPDERDERHHLLMIDERMVGAGLAVEDLRPDGDLEDRKSTRLNSSHVSISYAVFCLKKKRAAISPRAVLRGEPRRTVRRRGRA